VVKEEEEEEEEAGVADDGDGVEEEEEEEEEGARKDASVRAPVECRACAALAAVVAWRETVVGRWSAWASSAVARACALVGARSPCSTQ